MSPSRARSLLLVASFPLVCCVVGCGDRQSSEPSGGPPAVAAANPQLFAELQGELSRIINETSITYQQLDYDYAEDLLDRLDRYEAYFAGGEAGDPPRFMPKLEADEELAHIREVIRRWEGRTGKDLRAEVDALKADVAARTGQERFHPEFQKTFSEAFDDFIKYEVEEILERRNRVIHREAEALLAPHRESDPEIVAFFEAMLDTPQYALVESGPTGADAPD